MHATLSDLISNLSGKFLFLQEKRSLTYWEILLSALFGQPIIAGESEAEQKYAFETILHKNKD